MELLKMHDFHWFCIIFVIDNVLWYFHTKIKNCEGMLVILIEGQESHTDLCHWKNNWNIWQNQWCIFHNSTKLIWYTCFYCLHLPSLSTGTGFQSILGTYITFGLAMVNFCVSWIHCNDHCQCLQVISCMRNDTKMMPILPMWISMLIFKKFKFFWNKVWPFFKRLDLAFRGQKG